MNKNETIDCLIELKKQCAATTLEHDRPDYRDY